MSAPQEVILSGIRPTGRLHYGNYFGAIHHFLRLQQTDATCYYFIADYHALTTVTEKTAIYRNTLDMLRTYRRLRARPGQIRGLPPERPPLHRRARPAPGADHQHRPPRARHRLQGQVQQASGRPEDPTATRFPTASWATPCSWRRTSSSSRPTWSPWATTSASTWRWPATSPEIQRPLRLRSPQAPRAVGRDALRLPGLDGSAKMGKSDNNTLDLLDDPRREEEDHVRRHLDGPLPSTPTATTRQVIHKLPGGLQHPLPPPQPRRPRGSLPRLLDQYRQGGKFYSNLKKAVVEHVSNFSAPIIERFNDPPTTTPSSRTSSAKTRRR